MAQVTMELRHLLTMTNFSLFDFDYEITDLSWKAKLEQSFIDEFYFNEIGQETPDRWKHYVKRKFTKIMPYYNKLYQSTLQEINPLITHKRNETYIESGKDILNGTVSDVGSTTSDNTNTSKNFDYPQNANPLLDIASGSEISDNNSVAGTTSDTTSESISNRNRDYEKIIEGMDGDQSSLLKSYRDNILRINEMILKECKDLFILIY